MRSLIIGAGIGGLTCALAMEQRGFEVQVFEKTPELKPVGAGIALGINAMRVLSKLKIADQVIERGNCLERMYIGTPEGKALSCLDLCPLEETFGIPFVTIHRADLHEILTGALPQHTLQLGEELIEYQQMPSQVIAQFASGHKESGQILIGSDGIHSLVRKKNVWRATTSRCKASLLERRL